MKKLLLVLVLLSVISCEKIGDINGDLFGELLEEPIDHLEGFVISSLGLSEFTDEDNAELYPYVDMFVADAKRYGIDLDYIYDGRIVLAFTNTLVAVDDKSKELKRKGGVSYGGLDDESIIIYIDKKIWDNPNSFEVNRFRMLIMYHELGHDVFGYLHTETILMRSPWSELSELSDEEIIADHFNNY